MHRTSPRSLIPYLWRRRASGGVLLSLHLLTATGTLGAAVTWAPPVRADGSNQTAEVLFLLDGLPGNLDPEQVRAAVARELGTSVTLTEKAPSGANALTLHGGDGQHIRLSYRAADGRVIERDVDLPDASDRAVELVALLAGNLVRDEAAELGAAFMKKSAKPPPPAATATTAPGATTPPPGPKPGAAAPPLRAREHLPRRFVTVDLLPFVGTSSFVGVGASRHLSLNVLAGVGESVEGLEIGGLFNINSAFVHGAQLAGLANVTLGPVKGAQLAGLANAAQGIDGVQAGLVNVVTRDASGFQAGFVDLVGGDLKGAQLGLIEITAGNVRGDQIGLVNIGGGSISGAQIGLVNIATGSVRGAQIGFINVSTSSTFSLGFLNVFTRGRLHLDFWGQESGLLMAGIKHGSGYFHNIYGVGILPVGDRARVALSLGVGAHFPLSSRLFLDVDLLDYAFFGASAFEVVVNLAQTRVVLGGRLGDHLAIYGGPSYNVATSFDGQEPGLSPYGVNFTGSHGKNIVQGWPGLVLGVQGL
jgi:hypothetical protein